MTPYIISWQRIDVLFLLLLYTLKIEHTKKELIQAEAHVHTCEMTERDSEIERTIEWE